VDFISDLVSENSIITITQWLKFLYASFIVVAVYSLANVYLILSRQKKNIKKIIIIIIASACFIAFLLSLVSSIAVPYFVWGCEGSNFALISDDNLKSTSLLIEINCKEVEFLIKQNKRLLFSGPSQSLIFPQSLIAKEWIISEPLFHLQINF
jgi:hypothetical protein